MADPAFYKRDGTAIAQNKNRLTELESKLTEAFQRWEALEGVAD